MALGKFLGKLVGGLGGELLETGKEIADEFIESPEERKEFALRYERLITDRLQSTQAALAARFEMVANVIQAEMASGDNYTKRARPTVVYAGLAMIFINYILVPFVGLFVDGDVAAFPLPTEFWVAWGGVVGLWTVGRSAEKRGTANKVTQAITGSGANNVVSILDRFDDAA